MKTVLNITKNPFKFPWKFLQHSIYPTELFHNKFSWPLWWPVSLSIRVQTTLNHIRFVFTTVSKIMKEIFVNICSQLKTPTPTWKCMRCIMQMSYLYASDFPLKNFFKLAQHAEAKRKTLFGKRVMTRTQGIFTNIHFALGE